MLTATLLFLFFFAHYHYHQQQRCRHSALAANKQDREENSRRVYVESRRKNDRGTRWDWGLQM